MSDNNVGCSCQSKAPLQLDNLVKEPTNTNISGQSDTPCVETANILGYNRVALLCLASISAGLKNMFNGAKNAREIVAVDGCPVPKRP